ncbi:MAG TPA: zinc ribbon domain-containing protein [Vicinamibacterales bacterium]|jgi:hypothetical protein
MICKHCGTEIADKALVCYRCGHATSEPTVRQGQAAPPRGRGVIVIAALLVLMLSALFMSQAAAGQAPRSVSWVVAGLAVIVLVWRLATRRR